MNYWLIKSEPDCYSIDDLKKDKKIPWNGVRNYQARNYMRDHMKLGDVALFYHSSTKLTGIYGVAKVVSKPHADVSATDPKDEHFDPKSTKEKPVWVLVDVSYIETFQRLVSIEEMRSHEELEAMVLLQKGSSLSVSPVTKKEFEYIKTLSRNK